MYKSASMHAKGRMGSPGPISKYLLYRCSIRVKIAELHPAPSRVTTTSPVPALTQEAFSGPGSTIRCQAETSHHLEPPTTTYFYTTITRLRPPEWSEEWPKQIPRLWQQPLAVHCLHVLRGKRALSPDTWCQQPPQLAGTLRSIFPPQPRHSF